MQQEKQEGGIQILLVSLVVISTMAIGLLVEEDIWMPHPQVYLPLEIAGEDLAQTTPSVLSYLLNKNETMGYKLSHGFKIHKIILD